jgi:hypothetical protein
MTPYEESQLMSMMQQMLADMAYTNAQIDAHLTKLENNTQELQSTIHNSQSPTFATSVQS